MTCEYNSKIGYNWAKKRVLIVGLARSGIAAANLLLLAGAHPILYDEKPLEKLSPDIDKLLKLGCKLALDKELLELLKESDVLLISPGISLDSAVVRHAAKLGILCIGELELGTQFASGPIYAITGTNGKTTTVSLLEAMFKKEGYGTFACGNIGFPISSAALCAEQNAPLAVEVSSFQLETVKSFHPYAAAVLNITPDHLNRHGTMDAYIKLKREIFRHQSFDDFAILNYDDELVSKMAEGLLSHKLWFSRLSEIEEGAFVQDGKLILRFNGKQQTICKIKDILIRGNHNLENALAAVVMAGIAGIHPDIIRSVLGSFAGVEHRIEQVRKLDNINYINDSKGTNSASTINAIEAMDEKTVLLAGGYDKQQSFTALAEAIRKATQIIHVIVYGQTALKIEAALQAFEFVNVSRAADMFIAVDMARAILNRSGGTILLSPACASFDQFSDYEQRGSEFKKYVIALESEKNGIHDE